MTFLSNPLICTPFKGKKWFKIPNNLAFKPQRSHYHLANKKISKTLVQWILFISVDRKHCSLQIFADDWIRTADLWNKKQPLYQLRHNHCPSFTFRTDYWVPYRRPRKFATVLLQVPLNHARGIITPRAWMSSTKAEIKHSDWLLKVTWLVLTNHSALFHGRIATLKFVHDINSRRQSRIKI